MRILTVRWLPLLMLVGVCAASPAVARERTLLHYRSGSEASESVTVNVGVSGRVKIVDTTFRPARTIRYQMSAHALRTLRARIAGARLSSLKHRYAETGTVTTCGPAPKTVSAEFRTVHIGGGYPKLPAGLAQLNKRMLSVINTHDPLPHSGSHAHAAYGGGYGTCSTAGTRL